MDALEKEARAVELYKSAREQVVCRACGAHATPELKSCEPRPHATIKAMRIGCGVAALEKQTHDEGIASVRSNLQHVLKEQKDIAQMNAGQKAAHDALCWKETDEIVAKLVADGRLA